MDAATKVVADQGLRGLTHRAVDREAGLSEGSCSAYYRTRQALQLGLAEHVAGTLTEDVVALASELQNCDIGSPLPCRTRSFNAFLSVA